MRLFGRRGARSALAIFLVLVAGLVVPSASPQVRVMQDSPAPQVVKQGVRDSLAAMLPSADKRTGGQIRDALKNLDRSLEPGLWVDGWHLGARGAVVFDQEQLAVERLLAIKGPSPGVTAAIAALIGADRRLAQTALDEAVGGDPRELAKANGEMAKAAGELGKGHPNLASDHYGKAWEHARKAAASPAGSQTFTLRTCQVSELIAAITQANATTATDTINLKAGCTYTLLASIPGDPWEGGLPLVVNPLTIHGNGATIERDLSAPLFSLLGVQGSTAGGTFAVDHVTFRGGASGSGGAIAVRWQGGPDGPVAPPPSVVVSDSTFTGNSTAWTRYFDPGGSGGAIAVEGGPMGMGASSTVTLERDTFADNWTHSGPAYPGTDQDPRNSWDPRAGGAVFVSGVGETRIVGCTFGHNWTGDGYDGASVGITPADGGAAGDGGAVFASIRAPLTVTDSVFTGNHTGTGGAGAGGGSVGRGGSGGALWYGTISPQTVTFARNTFTGNSTGAGGPGGSGGALFVQGGAQPLLVTASTFDSNTTAAGGSGGALWTMYAQASVVNSTFVGSTLNFGSSGVHLTNDTLSGGGVSGSNSQVQAANTIFAGVGCQPGLVQAANGNSSPNISFSSPVCPGTSGDPKLSPLASNAGPTQTMALGDNSAAIDAADASICAAPIGQPGQPGFGAGGVDQRGVTRPQGAGCDLGAYESDKPPPGPQTFTLTTCAAGELIAAVNEANTTTAADTIELKAGCTYTLTSGPIMWGGATGLPIVVQPLTIYGNGAVIARDPSAPAFRLLGVWQTALSLDHLTLSGGRSSGLTPDGSGSDGGAIRASTSVLVVDHATFSGNTAADGADGVGPGAANGGRGGSGGAIFANGPGTVTISDSVFDGNSTGAGGTSSPDGGNGGDGGVGGAVAGWGPVTLTLTRDVFTGNSTGAGGDGVALGGDGGRGGAVAQVYGGSMQVADSTFTGNSTGDGGPGTAGDGGGGSGGALHSTAPTTVTGSTFTLNSTGALVTTHGDDTGGGLSVMSDTGMLTVANSTFDRNHAGGGGGGVFTATGATGVVTVTGSTFTGNTAGGGGGGMAVNWGTAIVANSTFYGNQAGSGPGGAIQVYQATAHVTSSTLTGNSTGLNAGGVFADLPMSMANSIVADNTSAFGNQNCEPGMTVDDRGGNVTFNGYGCPATFLTGDPKLLPLALNAPGSTQSMALDDGSAAIGAAVGSICVAPVGPPGFGAGGVDQRGVARLLADCDSGAYERTP